MRGKIVLNVDKPGVDGKNVLFESEGTDVLLMMKDGACIEVLARQAIESWMADSNDSQAAVKKIAVQLHNWIDSVEAKELGK